MQVVGVVAAVVNAGIKVAAQQVQSRQLDGQHASPVAASTAWALRSPSMPALHARNASVCVKPSPRWHKYLQRLHCQDLIVNHVV